MATIEILNLNKVLKQLDKISDVSLKKALQDSCLLVENDAKRNCPVDTGELRASITSTVTENTGEVGTNVSYAPYVEYGTGIFAVAGNGRQDRWVYQDARGEWHSTRGQKPQPFLEPALRKNREKIIDIFKQEIEKELKE